ncbi:MAG: amino acid adenylation domain-containing protein, partial [Pseudonocardiaceae bacterium]
MNQTAVPVPDGLLHGRFAEQVALRGAQPAVISPRRTLSYTDLDRHANHIAAQLRQRTVRPNTLVAVCMEKGWEQVAAVLGILRAGAAYLPLDPELPTSRLLYLLANGQVEHVLTQPWVDQRLCWPDGVQRIVVDGSLPEAGGDDVEFPHSRRHDGTSSPSQTDLAYVIFTSGSTGQPKGVMIDHRGALNTVLDINRRFGVGPQDRVLALSALSFDLSVYDVFGPLSAGGAIVLPDPASEKDPAHWVELMRRERVTLWNSVPALMEMLVEHRDTSVDSLRLALLSGDWIAPSLPGRIVQRHPGAEVISLGGATEASIWSIMHPARKTEPGARSIPYGRPLDNQGFHVLNQRFEPCPELVPGELYIAGTGLAQGYWRDGEKTAASFCTHPVTGERLYRTGDVGRYLRDATIEFLGREDSQVKVNGYRIE